jgi:hypothetical protein
LLKRVVISTGGVMGLRPTQGNEKQLGLASTLYGTVTLSLSSRPERSGAEGFAALSRSHADSKTRCDLDGSRSNKAPISLGRNLLKSNQQVTSSKSQSFR